MSSCSTKRAADGFRGNQGFSSRVALPSTGLAVSSQPLHMRARAHRGAHAKHEPKRICIAHVHARRHPHTEIESGANNLLVGFIHHRCHRGRSLDHRWSGLNSADATQTTGTCAHDTCGGCWSYESSDYLALHSTDCLRSFRGRNLGRAPLAWASWANVQFPPQFTLERTSFEASYPFLGPTTHGPTGDQTHRWVSGFDWGDCLRLKMN